MFRRHPKRPPPGEYPAAFTRSFLRQTLPTATLDEARAALDHLRSKGWSEEEIAEQILPYMPRENPPPAGRASGPFYVPAGISTAWLDRNLPAMDAVGIRRVVDELERRGWSQADVAVAVLPHLLPKLPTENVNAILDGLAELGLSQEDIERLAPGG